MKAAIALVLSLAVVPAHAQLLKCVGKGGKVEYAAQCPEGAKEVQTGIRSAPGGPTSDAKKAPSLAEREAEFRKRRADQADAQAKQQKDAELAAQRQRACQDSRNYLSGLESGARVARNDPKTGERVFLEDAARAQEIALARKSVQTNCN